MTSDEERRGKNVMGYESWKTSASRGGEGRGTTEELKPWRSPNGHVLGFVKRVSVSANGRKYYASRLMLYRQAIDPKTGGVQEGDVMAVVEGTTLDVRCSVPGCRATRTWWIGEAGMERLLERMI